MSKKINIIGAGIAGLSAGCYLQMNGYDTEIFELHDKPGGLCTAWERSGYKIDGCIHWLVGTNPQSGLYRIWSELIDMSQLKIFEGLEYFRIEDQVGREIIIYRDVDRLEQELLEKAPEDSSQIRKLTATVRKFSKLEMPVDRAAELTTVRENLRLLLKLLPYGWPYLKLINISIGEYAARFRNPLLRQAITNLFVPEMAMLFAISTLAWMTGRNAGYPIGGSLNFARLIEKRYLELGGKINYKARVKQIHTSGKNPAVADGVELEDGTQHAADMVISAADGYATIFELLDGKFVDESVRRRYRELPVFSSFLQVSLGIARTFKREPSTIYLPIEPALEIDPETVLDFIGLRIFNDDPTLAPAGKTLVTIYIPTYNYAYWQNLKQADPRKYKAEKNYIAEEIVNVIEKRFGQIRANLEVIDVSTPATVIHYTNNWRGSMEGWLLNKKTGFQSMRKILPGLDNFFQIGQWVEPGGGVPTSLLSGRNVAQIICHKDDREFTTTRAQSAKSVKRKAQ
ncbi:MAG: NAD(P)/FAD-dependent oxidoreductase [Candidatus Marinimicrobia bacterium]|nr:NAD(P)/FAD-dependent oxidoreductase [Candidatus Neomarinimicrobiota bacterium]